MKTVRILALGLLIAALVFQLLALHNWCQLRRHEAGAPTKVDQVRILIFGAEW